jgi:hypothetical protein
VVVETLPSSKLPAALRGLGYDITEIGSATCPTPSMTGFVIGTGSELELVTAGSTRPITQIVTHTGIVATTVYALREPTVPPDPAMRIAP